MSDKPTQKSVVVRVEPIGDLKMLCFTERGEPAIYADSGPAEMYCAHLRDRYPDYRFAVIDFWVL